LVFKSKKATGVLKPISTALRSTRDRGQTRETNTEATA